MLLAELAINWQENRPKPFRNERGQIESKAKDTVADDLKVWKRMKELKQ